MKLRPYQQTAVDNTLKEFDGGNDSTLLVMPTGTGKTIVFAHIIKQMAGQGRAMVIAHRDELIRQAHGKIKTITGIEPDVEMAEAWASVNLFRQSQVVVSSVQTQNSGMGGKGRMSRFKPDDFGLLVIDEAHHATANSYRKVIDHFKQNPSLKVLGVTATPDRTDEEALGQVFKSVAYDYELLDAINDGWLVPIKQRYIEVDSLDFSKCRTLAGDFNAGDLDAVMQEEENLHGVIGPMLEIVRDRKTLIFATTCAHADRMCEIISRSKPGKACYVHGGTPKDERRVLLDDYRAGKYQFLTNVGIATEGFDIPSIEVIAMARPTKSRCLYAQMIGRATRPAEAIAHTLNDSKDAEDRRALIDVSEKKHMLVIDFTGNSGNHKLVSSADILGGNESEATISRAASNIKSEGGDVDMAEALAEARKQVDEGERKKRRNIIALSKWRSISIDPFGILDITPERERGWHRGRKPSEKQAAFLEKCGVEVTASLSFSAAHQLVGEMIQRRQRGMASFKQRKVLLKYGANPNVTFTEASAQIDRIAQAGWKKVGV